MDMPQILNGAQKRAKMTDEAQGVWGIDERFSLYLSIRMLAEVIMAVVLILVFSPLFLFLALLVKLDSKGPIFYTQKRLGRYGKPFTILKFRTMRADAERFSGPVWAMEDDPRITQVGRFLRSTHLDELPQLFNIILGQMSFIGPRPERPEIVAGLIKRIPNYLKRLEVRPGITGLAQVRHPYDRSIKDVRCKVRYDLLYIKSASLLLDIKIVFWTIEHMLSGKGI